MLEKNPNLHIIPVNGTKINLEKRNNDLLDLVLFEGKQFNSTRMITI